MCFSAEADFVTGALVGAIGVAALAKVEKPSQIVLGALPMVLAAHQVIEGFVWRGLEPGSSRYGTGVAVDAYVALAWVVLPVLLPLGLLLAEGRGRVMAPFLALGVLAGGYLLGSMLAERVTAHVVGHTIQYGGAGDLAVPATVVYVIATCGAPLFSRHRTIRWFGLANLAAVGAITFVQMDGLTSLWCAWAAVVSVAIYVQLEGWRRTDLRAIAAV